MDTFLAQITGSPKEGEVTFRPLGKDEEILGTHRPGELLKEEDWVVVTPTTNVRSNSITYSVCPAKDEPVAVSIDSEGRVFVTTTTSRERPFNPANDKHWLGGMRFSPRYDQKLADELIY